MHAIQNQHLPRSIVSGIAVTLFLMVGYVTAILVPLPLMYYRSKIGRKNSLIIPAAMLFILTVILKATILDLCVFTGCMALGFLLSECYELRLTVEKTILVSCITVIVSGVLLLLFYSNVSQTGIYDLAFSQVSALLNQLLELEVIEEFPDKLVHIVTCLLPGVIVSSLLFIAWVNVALSLPLFEKTGLRVPAFTPLSQWKAPEHLVWVVIVLTLGLMLPSEPLNLLSMNLMCIMMLVYFFQGISIVAFFLQKTRMPFGLKALLYWFVFIQFPFNLLVSAYGFFDTWIDVRRRVLRQNNPNE